MPSFHSARLPNRMKAPVAGRRMHAARRLAVTAMTLAGADVACAEDAANTIRSRLQAQGIELGATYTGEGLANVSGGLRRGAIYDGKLDVSIKSDLGRVLGLQGLSFYANAFQLHGTGRLKEDYTGSMITVSNIEALPATRLSELWLEQKIGSGDVTVRIGQLAADTEFFFSSTGNFFVNSDWPTIASVNLPSGGAAYPLATPGIRLRVQPSSGLAVLVALFNGDPAGPGPGDPQKRNRNGVNFRVEDPPFAIGEVQYSRNHDKDASGLAFTLKVGAWQHFGTFMDQRLGVDGYSLADPFSNGVPAQHRSNRGVYAVIDQQLYRPPGGRADSGVVVYTRLSASPSDRNLVDAYAEGGATVMGLIPGRPDDKIGAALSYARISQAARDLDRDAVQQGAVTPVRDRELTLEVSYQAQLGTGWVLQPLFQRVWHPSGSTALRDVSIIGLRTMLTY